MKLLARLMLTVTLGSGSAVADHATSVHVTGVTPYGGYQPYILAVLFPDGRVPSATAIDAYGKVGEIGFNSFSIVPGQYKLIYQCASDREQTYQGEATVTFRASQSYVMTCTSDPARLKVDECSPAGTNNSSKPNPLRGSTGSR